MRNDEQRRTGAVGEERRWAAGEKARPWTTGASGHHGAADDHRWDAGAAQHHGAADDHRWDAGAAQDHTAADDHRWDAGAAQDHTAADDHRRGADTAHDHGAEGGDRRAAGAVGEDERAGMPDAPRRERRSPMVMLLDAAMRLALAAQTGPEPKLVPAGRTRRVGVGWLAVGAVLAVAGTGIVIGALVTGRFDLASLPPHTAARQPAAAPEQAPAPAPESERPPTTAPAGRTPESSASPSGSASATGSAPPGPSRGAPAPPGSAAAPAAPVPVPLTAEYTYASGGTGLLGYAADVAVANPGTAPRDGWQLTVTLPRPTLQIADVTGAVVRQDGATWTFEPDETTRTVPAGGSVRITFEVRGATLLAAAPQDCRIDGRACAGLDGAG